MGISLCAATVCISPGRADRSTFYTGAVDVRGGAALSSTRMRSTRRRRRDPVGDLVSPSVGRDATRARDQRRPTRLGPTLLAPCCGARRGCRAATTRPRSVLVPDPLPLHSSRDVLAPAAARSRRRGRPRDARPPIQPATLAELMISVPTVERGKIECEARDLNRFGKSSSMSAGPARRTRPRGSRRDRGRPEPEVASTWIAPAPPRPDSASCDSRTFSRTLPKRLRSSTSHSIFPRSTVGSGIVSSARVAGSIGAPSVPRSTPAAR